ncbi:hypothetical protein MMC11_000916 [Xylographa trunciseda]|nr:hypothetical protein [Xylographa trunciseda]
MVIVLPGPALLDSSTVSLYYTKDTLLANLPVAVFYGPSTTTNSTLNSSRIQAHVYTLGGLQSYPRLTIAPTSPLYVAVRHITEEKQGDEICRGLAMSLLKYFTEMPKEVKAALREMAAIGRPDSTAPAMFDEIHAGTLAAKMIRLDNTEEVASYVSSALAEKSLSWTDVDVILPPRSIIRIEPSDDPDDRFLYADDGRPMVDYGRYEDLVKLFGSPTFLPTSKLKRALSKPTAISRSRILAKDQKESLRREMYELLDTEERYVGKLHDLVKSVAVEFCRNANSNPYQSTTPSERAMQKLFPESLSQILNLNTAFLDGITDLLRKTDEQAHNNINGNVEDNAAARTRTVDLLGTDVFAKALLEWFPRFKEPYQAYLRASSEFPRILNDFLRDSASNFSQKIHATGEQRLRSWLIEPVQRLPRYSLFIDNMVNQLPASHPALGRFLKAKDIITDICALENDQLTDCNQTTERLRDIVTAWPPSLAPQGRLVTAVDVTELKAPYRTTTTAKDGQASLMLLFPDSFVVLRKASSNSLSARGLLAEVDRPSTKSTTLAPDISDNPTNPKGLTFGFSFHLQETRFTECNGGRLISMACVRRSDYVDTSRFTNNRKYYAITRVFALLGSYEGKAARWNEEVGRARIEQRFPETMRESDKWALRSISPSTEALGVLAAVFENDQLMEEGKCRSAHGRIKVLIDHDLEERRSSAGDRLERMVEITIRVTPLNTGTSSEAGHFRLEFAGFFGGFTSTDNVSKQDFMAVFLKRLGNLQRMHHLPQTAEAAQAHISYHQKVVEALPVKATGQENQIRRFRPVSPVKALSNFLSGASKEENATKERTMGILDGPTMLPPVRLSSRSNSNRKPSDEVNNKVTVVSNAQATKNDSLTHLEDTFNAYMVSLRSRSGNVVGKVLRSRAGADELIVNELYNTLVEDPSKIQAAAEVSVDVLFAAFEKFLNKAWKDRMGPILGPQMLKDMQSVLDSSSNGRTPERFKLFLGEMTPQNKRAFIAMIKLLSDLLDASGNDGDRGVLIATFAEALVVEGNPHNYVTLLDHLVEDFDILFDEVGSTEGLISGPAADSLKRARSFNTGSLSSNASSIRKRFGFGTLSRENSKSESESRVGQVWRSLSKKSTTEGDSQPSSLSKAFLSRSRSTDTDTRKPLPSRPVSQDGSNTACTSQDPRPRPGSSHNTLFGLSTIGEAVSEPFQPSLKKKRRSSLSDLHAIMASGMTSFGSPAQPHKSHISEDSIKPFQAARTALRTPPSKSQIPSSQGGSPNRFGSPSRTTALPSKIPGSPDRKENSPLMTRSTLTERAVNRKTDDVVIVSFSPKKRENSHTGIPALKRGLQERSSPSIHPATSPPKPTRSPQKLRMQSPQKLRERLHQEKKLIDEAGPGLQAELTRIGEELSALNLSRPATKASGSDVPTLQSRVNVLEGKISESIAELSNRSASIQADLESSLVVNEKKAKSLDELYREANAENEALYERFNEELSKVLKAVKGGQGVEEMRAKMKEAQDDAARLKRENQRLKRENLGLRSQLRGE